MTAREVEENEPGSRDKEYRPSRSRSFPNGNRELQSKWFLLNTRDFNLFYTDGNDPAWRVWISGDSSELEEREI